MIVTCYQAQKYVLDPLTAPEPFQEDGPGTRFVKPASRASSTSKGPSIGSSKVSSHSKAPSVTVTRSPPQYTTYPTPPASASPTTSSFHPSNPYSPSARHSSSSSKNGSLRSPAPEPSNGKGRRRGSSLTERYTGDMSHRPLDQIRKDTKKANRSPHLKKQHIPGADVIDTLDSSMFGGVYHHEGPYDATLISRNLNPKISPVAATEHTNAEAIRATPRENIRDALEKHIPLQGTSTIPSGAEGHDGKVMRYEEGADLMREEDASGGAYKRWPGVQYHPDDLKGKGEPSFTIERALKEQKRHDHRRVLSDGNSAYEMQAPRSRSSGGGARGHSGSVSGDYLSPEHAANRVSGNDMSYAEYEGDMQRRQSTGGKLGGLKKRLGSLRRKARTNDG
ncbi:hypothetical protein PVAG01_06317 [Phlyctema vagabunda]|uniref:Palmdelphin n=1 Tax=Phlyctema vagabunda TaxID=108571 RepID=A0ABR4PFP9_9HELO